MRTANGSATVPSGPTATGRGRWCGTITFTSVGNPYRSGPGASRSVRILSEQERLTAAASEINLTPVAGTAGFLHPILAAKALEGGRFVPDPGQRVLANIAEIQPWYGASGVTGQRDSRRVDQH